MGVVDMKTETSWKLENGSGKVRSVRTREHWIEAELC